MECVPGPWVLTAGEDGENRAHGGVLEGVFSGVWSYAYV